LLIAGAQRDGSNFFFLDQLVKKRSAATLKCLPALWRAYPFGIAYDFCGSKDIGNFHQPTRLIADYSGHFRTFVQICAMPEEWLRPGDAAQRYSLGRNTPGNWFKAGRIRRRDGRYSRRDIERELGSNSIGRPPGKKPKNLRDLKLSQKEKDSVDPYLRPQGLRKLERTLNALAIAAGNWTPAVRKRWAEKLRDGANAVEQAQPTEAREKQRSAAKQRVAYREDKRKWKKRRQITEAVEDVVPPADDNEPLEVVPFFIFPASEVRTPELRAALDAKIGTCMKAKDPLEMVRRAEKFGFKMATRSDHRPADKLEEQQKDRDNELLKKVAARKNRKWVKRDDGSVFKAIPLKSTR
jgi:hypothetical protein